MKKTMAALAAAFVLSSALAASAHTPPQRAHDYIVKDVARLTYGESSYTSLSVWKQRFQAHIKNHSWGGGRRLTLIGPTNCVKDYTSSAGTVYYNCYTGYSVR